MLSAMGLVLGSALVQNAFAVTWAAVGKLGYKEVSPSEKKCATCAWFTADPKTPNAGTCKLAGIKNANGGGEVHVKAEAFCMMWKKRA